jgi:hypothetical protein
MVRMMHSTFAVGLRVALVLNRAGPLRAAEKRGQRRCGGGGITDHCPRGGWGEKGSGFKAKTKK